MVPIGLALPVRIVLLFVLDDFGQPWPTGACKLTKGWSRVASLPASSSPYIPPIQLCHNFCHQHLTVGQKSMGFESEGQGGYILLSYA